MATDATGTPTPLGIPKFNTSADAPSGLGSNAQMDSIDALLAQTPRSGSIAGIAVGSVPVWNGTAWVKPTGTPDGTKFLRDDGSWQPMGAWNDYTPAWSGTQGNGTKTGRYVQTGKTVIGWARIVWGSTTSHTASVQTLGLPVAAALQHQLSFFVHLVDASAGEFKALGRVNDASSIALFSGGEAVVAGIVTNTVPFTWTTSDEIRLNFFYEAA